MATTTELSSQHGSTGKEIKVEQEHSKIAQRPLGSCYNNENLAESVSIVGLGCSSFSTFFWNSEDWDLLSSLSSSPPNQQTQISRKECWTLNDILSLVSKDSFSSVDHTILHGWVETIRYAVLEAGITLLDTAPWYGHGVSEVVIGLSISVLAQDARYSRNALTINTKVGRYESDPQFQFDFSHSKVLTSVQLSLQRMKLDYIDVIQLHDPEFAFSLEQLMAETLPALLECQQKGWCRAIGMTGYPLHIQHQILEQSMHVFRRNIWDQTLTYGHFNLHDTTLLRHSFIPSSNNKDDPSRRTYATYCHENKLTLLAAAPLSMGLLTHNMLPFWHPAPESLKEACQHAASIAHDAGVDLAELALLFALSEPRLSCTLLGMKNVEQVKAAQRVAGRVANLVSISTAPTMMEETYELETHLERLRSILTPTETEVLDKVLGTAGLLTNLSLEDCQWDGVEAARDFWQNECPWKNGEVPTWHAGN